MELDNKQELRTEPLPEHLKDDYKAVLIREIETNEILTQTELYEKLELILLDRANSNSNETNKNKKLNHQKINNENRFILGQFYFDLKKYKKAYDVFDSIKDSYLPGMYQLGAILYDDLLDKDESIEDKKTTEIDTIAAFRHPNKDRWRQGFEYMLKISETTDNTDEIAQFNKLIHQAQYNVGKAYFQGFGVKQSDSQAEKYWLLAADDGSPDGCVNAMTSLAFFYSRKMEKDFFDLKKAYFWHNEACGNGSLESQGALGAMYYFGIGCKQDMQAAYECLTNSSERGNIYSMALLCDYYYRNKFYIKAAELSKKVSALSDVDKISEETKCLRSFIAKGIALASFTHARCLELGRGLTQNNDLAKQYYKRSYYYDPDLCQLFQNFTTHQKI